MTPQNAREYIPLLEALADGELQINMRPDCDGPFWCSCDDASFHLHPELYRRKPKPTIVPWDRESCPVGAVVRRSGARVIIMKADDFTASIAYHGVVTYQVFLRDWTMDDGSACGVVQK